MTTVYDYSPVISGHAAQMGSRYRPYGASTEDMTQEAWLWILNHEAKVQSWLAEDGGERRLGRAVRNQMQDYGERLKAQHLGYDRSDLYHYAAGEVKALLDIVFDPDEWLHPPTGDGGRAAPKDLATGNGWVATLADVTRAFEKLDVEDRDMLHAFHRDGWTNNELAEELDINSSTMSYRHSRAVKRLVDHLGGPRPKSPCDNDCEHDATWRGRHAMSTAQARAITAHQYEE